MSTAEWGGLPFKEQIDFFRAKVNLPTEKYTDLEKGMHSRAFSVAGATKDELLVDLRTAVDKAMSQGTTLEEFRKDFDVLVKKHGWAYNGERGWRTRVILDTNLRTAHSAGRYKQQTDPEVMKLRPYWRYRHGDSVHPRPLHVSWDGITLPADHAWFDDHYTPCGWGCDCKIQAVTARDLKRDGKSGPDTPPDDGTYVWKNPNTGKEELIPRGIDPGWNYNPGKAAWGRPISKDVADAWAATGEAGWESITPGDAASYGRPEELPAFKPSAKLGKPARDKAELQQMIKDVIGGAEHAYEYPVADFTYSVNVNAETLAEHLELDRGRFVPLLPEVFNDPYEVWLSFYRSKTTGVVALRHTLLKVFDLGGKDKGVIIAAQAVKGQLETWTVVPVRNLSYLQKKRVGKLLVAK